MTEIKASDEKLYISAIFDCYDLAILGLAMDTNMKASLCEQTLDNAVKAYQMLCGAILHRDRGTQYTSELYRKAINKYGIRQSMNSAGGSIDRTSLRKKCKVILTISIFKYKFCKAEIKNKGFVRRVQNLTVRLNPCTSELKEKRGLRNTNHVHCFI